VLPPRIRALYDIPMNPAPRIAPVLLFLCVLTAIAQERRPDPPVRAADAPGAPKFSVAGAKPGDTELRAAPGVNPPVDAEGDWLVGPDYIPAPEMTVVDGVPQGRVEQFVMDSADSEYYPGIARDVFGTPDPNEPRRLIVDTHPQPWKRTITVYVPAGYVPGTPAPLLVVHDGPKEVGKPDMMIPRILDNMIAQKRVPAMVVVMIANGGGDAQGSQRGLEYDTLSGKFAEFIQFEVLPAVEKHCGVKFTDDPEGRCAMGVSSGAAAAFTMAWYHNEWYHRVISYTGTFVNQQWPFNPDNPGGAWDYHERIVPESDVKPIRIWMQVGDRDLLNPNVMRDGMHDWVEANHRMAAVLKAKGYHYQYVFSLDCLHGARNVREQTLPQALEWVWRGYPIAPAAAPVAGIRATTLEAINVDTLAREVLYSAPGKMESPHFSPDGSAIYFNRDGQIKRLKLGAGQVPVVINTGPLIRCNNDHGISPDGTLLAVSDLTETGRSLMYLVPIDGGTPRRIPVPDPSYWHGWSPDGKTITYLGGRDGAYDVYTIDIDGDTETRLTDSPGNDNGPDYSADGKSIWFHSNRTGKFHVWRMNTDGSAQEQLTDDEYDNWFPHPSPDGKWIAILSTTVVPDTGHPPDGEYSIRLIPADGGAIREIARFNGGNGSFNVPSWSRDGTRLAFASYEFAP
jgi:enterochelin esterase-like enzyme